MLCLIKNQKEVKEYPHEIYGYSLALIAAIGISIGFITGKEIVKVKHVLCNVFYQYIGSSLTVIPILIWEFESY